MLTTDLASTIDAAFTDAATLDRPEVREAVEETIARLDRGEVRLAEPGVENGEWQVHAWVQRAILLYFRLRQMETVNVGPFEYHDKIPLKHGYEELGVRVVPPATARYGAFLTGPAEPLG